MDTQDTSQQTKSKRCDEDGCKKKLNLTSFACRCTKTFCPQHRPTEVHKCTFDYNKKHQTDLLKYMSTAIVAEKISII